MNTMLTRLLGETLTQPLRERNFLLYWLGQTVSILGDRVSAVALPFLVLGLGGSAVQLGQLAAVYSAAQLAFLLLGGVLVDRFSRRSAMIFTDLLRGIILGLVVFLLLEKQLSVSYLFAMYLVFGLCSAFFMPASASIMPEIVSKPLLVSANALRSFAAEFCGIVGPAFAGILIGFGGLALALSFDALSFFVGVACLLAIRVTSRTEKPSGEKSSYWSEIAEGFRLIAGSRWLWVTVVLFAFVNVFFAGSTSVLFPLLAKERLGDVKSLGWLFSGLAAGSLLGALLVGRLGKTGRRGLAAYLAVVADGIGLILLAFVQNPVLAVAVAVLMGASLVVFGVIWESTLQEMVPLEALGRVASVDMLGSFALLPLGFLAVGWVVERVGVVDSLLVCGGGVVLLALIGLGVREIRELR